MYKRQEVGHTTFRPPYTPVTIGAIVGREVGKHSKPTRKSPMHLWHEKNNAVFVDAGLWLRPRYYKQGNETLEQAAKREAENVRNNIGLCDVTSLGKIDINRKLYILNSFDKALGQRQLTDFRLLDMRYQKQLVAREWT